MTKIPYLLSLFCAIGQGYSDTFTDRCNQKIGTIVPGAGSVFGNTMDANTTFSLDLKLIPCGPTNEFFDLSNAGVFYKMIGTGAKVRITTCSTQAQFISRASVFKSCDSSSCVDSAAETKLEGGSNTTCFDEESKAILEFESEAGVEYSLFVQDDQAGISGGFAMWVHELPPDNAFCNTPPVLEMDKTYKGYTGGSVTDENAPACNGTSSNGPGVWFGIPAEMDDETEVVMVTCSKEPFDFLVYAEGGCSELSCVDVKPKREAKLCDDGTIESRVEWIPTKGQSYYVHMFGEEGANFRMAFGRPLMRKDSSGGSLSGKLAGGLVATAIVRLVIAILMLE